MSFIYQSNSRTYGGGWAGPEIGLIQPELRKRDLHGGVPRTTVVCLCHERLCVTVSSIMHHVLHVHACMNATCSMHNVACSVQLVHHVHHVLPLTSIGRRKA